ncbi:MAG: Gfo/Idh/MocA family oxidoreductase [Pirellulales bacterium]|nr:Gfo/Idh/MocA family oxidoreductase [Pirellulales bacterium]
MSRSTRREFIRTGAGLAAAGSLTPYWLTGQRASAEEPASKNDRPLIGAVGMGSRGMAITVWASKFGDVAAVCDLDRNHAEEARKIFKGKPDVYDDYRKLLERKDLDVIINGTPDHWHTAVNVAACRAGKDVYTEKPLTLTIDEGKLLCKVVEETGRIVQVGTQQRSDSRFQTAVELVRNGRLGTLRQVWVSVPYWSTKGGPFPDEPVPDGLDWNMYQGQAPEHAYCHQRTHGVFRWWYEYAGGVLTDWGNHHVDIAHWGMDCEHGGPSSVDARGLFPNPQGPQYYNTPDRFFARMQYPRGVELLFFSALNQRARYGEVEENVETSPEEMEKLFGKDVPEEILTFNRDGIMFLGDKGRVFVNRGGLYGKPVEELKENPLPDGAWRTYPSTDHMANFFECVKSRKQPCAPVQIEHRTVTACHLTNISLRLNRKIAWDPKTQQIVGDTEANAWLKRNQRAPYVIV